MNNVSIRIAGCLFVLAALFWSLSCNTSTPNSNVAQNQSSTADAGNANVDPLWGTSSACKDENITMEEKRALVEADIAKQIRGDGKLKKQLDGEGTQQKRFKYRVVIQDKYLIAYFEGRIDGENQLEDLSEILNNFKKNKCVLRVILVPTGTLPDDPNQPMEPSMLSRGFEWNLCDWPQQPCSDGQCHDVCPSMTSNSNANVNVNANANVNMNVNANRIRAND